VQVSQAPVPEAGQVLHGPGDPVLAVGVHDVVAGVAVSWSGEHGGHPGPVGERLQLGVGQLGAEREDGGAAVAEEFLDGLYADVRACLKSHEQLVNTLGNDMDGTHDSYGTGNLVAQDQPRHTVLRTVVRPSFAAREILALEDHIRGRARELLAGLAARGGGDLAAEFAIPLVFAASLRLMGIDPAESPFWEEHLMRSMVRTVGQFGVPADAAASNHDGEAHLDELMRRRAAEIAAGAEAGTPDVISQILLADANGRLLEGERIGLGHLIFSASTDAPAALATNCVAVLDKFPALQGYLREHPGLVTAFVEETLRYDGPAKNLCRQTT
jgi:cytochrome P450